MENWYDSANFYHIFVLGLCNAPFQNDYSITSYKLSEMDRWIPHIKAMGCNSILLSPVFKSKTHGYDTTDYYQIDNRLGDNASFKSLVQTLHQNNIRVVLDGVFNHCGRDFFAFEDVCKKGQESEYCHWFSGITFDRGNDFGDRFSYDTWNGYYELVKFNLKNPMVKEYLFNAVKYWMDYFDIDGLRLDAADVLDFDFMKELRQMTTGLKPDFWLMGEVVHGDYSKWVNQDVLHSVTNYVLYKGLYSSHNDQNLFELAYTLKYQFEKDGICQGLRLYNFADNHDQPRIASRVSDPAYLFTIYMLLYTMPGMPSLYYGSEWGIKGEKTNNSDEPLRPYIDIDNICESIPNLLSTLEKLSYIRNNSKALKLGTYKQLYIEFHKPFAFERAMDDERIIVVVNITPDPIGFDLQAYGLQFFDLLNDEQITAANVEIAAHWGRILKIQ